MRIYRLVLSFIGKVLRRLRMLMLRPLFARYGKNFIFDPSGIYSFENIYVGDDVYIGPRCILIAANSHVRIGSKTMFGPGVTVIGGNHRIDIAGKYMRDVKPEEKGPSYDRGVTIGEDVWVGAGAMILDGVSIGRGAVIGAGAVVTTSVEPYSIVTGERARHRRYRWPPESITVHEGLIAKAVESPSRNH